MSGRLFPSLGSWLALACLACAVPAIAKDGPVGVDAELVIAVDVSYSMDAEEQRLQRGGYVQAITSPEFLAALKLGAHGSVAIVYMEWASSSDTKVLMPWTLIDGPEKAQAFADRLAELPIRRASRTSVSGAIDASVKLFEANGFNGTRRVIDVSGDGPNNNGRPVTHARDEAVAQGITINGLPLVDIRPYIGMMDIKELDWYYEDCVIGGAGSFMIPVNSTKKFVDATRTKMVLEIAGLQPSKAEPLIKKASGAEPRISCLIGESLWQRRFGN